MKADLLAALSIYRQAKSGRVWLAKEEAGRVLDQIMNSVPALRNRFRKGTLKRLCALHKSEPLESDSDTVSGKALSVKPQPVPLSMKPILVKEGARIIGPGLVCQVRMGRSLFKETKLLVPSVAKRVKDGLVTLDVENSSCGEGKFLRLQLSPAVQRDPAIDSRSAKQNSRRPGYTKNFNSTADTRPKGEGDSVAGQSNVGADGRTDTNLATKSEMCRCVPHWAHLQARCGRS